MRFVLWAVMIFMGAEAQFLQPPVASSYVIGFRSGRDTVDGPLTNAELNQVGGMALRNEILYFSDAGDDVLRRINLTAATVETVAEHRWDAEQLTVTRSFFAVFKPYKPFDLTTVNQGVVEGLIDGGGEGFTFGLDRAYEFAIDLPKKYAYITDSTYVHRMSIADFRLSQFVGTSSSGSADGTGKDATIYEARGITIFNEFLYFSDEDTIRRINTTNAEVTTIISDAVDRRLHSPIAMDLVGSGPASTIYFLDRDDDRLRRLDLMTLENTIIAGQQTGGMGRSEGIGTNAIFEMPRALVLDPIRNIFFLGARGAIFEVSSLITSAPSVSSTDTPTASPSESPSSSPRSTPTITPTALPTCSPTSIPTATPTCMPSISSTTLPPSLSPSSLTPHTTAPTSHPSLSPSTFAPTESLSLLARSSSLIILSESYPPWAPVDVSGSGSTRFSITNQLLGNPSIFISCDTLDQQIARLTPSEGFDQSQTFLESGQSIEYDVRSVYNPDHEQRMTQIVCAVDGVDGGSEQFEVPVIIRDVAWPIITDWLIDVNGRKTSSVFSTGNGNSAYSVTLNTATRIVALANPIYGGFVNTMCPNITVGGIPAAIESCSELNVTFITPTFTDLCDVQDCGYHTIEISNPDGLHRTGSSDQSLGGYLLCPGQCSIEGLGFFYTDQCQGFTSPLECAQIQNNVEGCAFGVGDSCRPCDRNAYCPGGVRMWPRQGFWTANERVGHVNKCPAPSQVRCQGWSFVDSESECGEGYTGTLCSSCDDGFYEELGICRRCPSRTGSIFRVAILCAIAIIVFIIVYLCLKFSKVSEGKPELKPLVTWQAKDFAIWTILMLQHFALVTSTATATAPATAAVLSWMNIASLDFQAVGPECFSRNSDAFAKEYAVFSSILVAMALLVLSSGTLGMKKVLNILQGSFGQHLRSLRGYIFVFSIAMYTPSTFLGAGSVYCIDSNEEGRGKTLVSWVNPNFDCAGTEHAPVMALGISVLILHSIFFPIWSFIKVRSVYIRGNLNNKFMRLHYRKFFGDDFLPPYYWMLHCQMALIFVLCMTRVFLSTNNKLNQIVKLIINGSAIALFSSLLIKLRPHVRHMAWKFPVQLSILNLLVLVSILEYLNFLFAEEKLISRGIVEALSNFVLFGYCFWFVAFRKKGRDYYQQHFMLQKRGRLSAMSILSNSARSKLPQLSFARPISVSKAGSMFPNNDTSSMAAHDKKAEDVSGVLDSAHGGMRVVTDCSSRNFLRTERSPQDSSFAS
eukprot:jgi/Bigna1/91869/estExt_fgenesh1_pg.C_1260016